MRSELGIALIIVVVSTPLAAAAKPTPPDPKIYSVLLTSRAELTVTQPLGSAGDQDGTGSVKLAVDPARQQLCYSFTLAKLATPLMAHIHKGQASRTGPSVITLFTGPGGQLNDCVTWTEERLAEIVSDPSNFYVNLSTTEYPDGALRGQLAA